MPTIQRQQIDLESPIRINNLTKLFGKKLAVKVPSSDFGLSGTVGLVGVNGAGKSTLLKLILGILHPTEGDVTVFGIPSYKNQHLVKQHVGYVPEIHHIYRNFTVNQTLKFAAAMYSGWDREFECELLSIFSLDRSQSVSRLSRGMLAKLALIVALAHHPRILLLDEPISGLDPIARDDFLDVAVRKADRRPSQLVIFSSHQLDEVQEFADRIVIMNRGRIVMDKEKEALLKGAFSLTVREFDPVKLHNQVGESPLTVFHRGAEARIVVFDVGEDQLKEWCISRGLTLVSHQPCSLDDFFKALARNPSEVRP